MIKRNSPKELEIFYPIEQRVLADLYTLQNGVDELKRVNKQLRDSLRLATINERIRLSCEAIPVPNDNGLSEVAERGDFQSSDWEE